jgi:hypothetical protein
MTPVRTPAASVFLKFEELVLPAIDTILVEGPN